MATPDLRLVAFAIRDDYIAAMKNYDDCFTNFSFGSVLEVDEANPKLGKTLIGIYRGNQLV